MTGISALKSTKVGKGGGARALYALPWYVIIGPPGAGKTTALKQSGLVFPHLDPSRGGVRGIGGTRNCDWWFTNEGILLDTAGRYATEDDDREEWLAFLNMMRKYRPRKPLNGLLVAVAAGVHSSWRAVGVPFEVGPFADHTIHLTLEAAENLFQNLPLQILSAKSNVEDTKARARKQPPRHAGDRLKRVFFKNALYEVVARRA